MYYYVYEPVRTTKDRRTQDKIKRLISQLGIMGEAVTPNPARTVDELIQIALTKNYTTVVAVGSDQFANKVASSLLNQKDPQEAKQVFGFVPLDLQTSTLANKISITSIEDAVQALRYRRVKTLSLGMVTPNKYFLIPLTISAATSFEAQLYLPDFGALIPATTITVSPDIEIICQDTVPKDNQFMKFIKSFVTKETQQDMYSRFTTDVLELKTEPSLPVYLGDEVIAKTPIRVKALPDYLHIIVNRDTLRPVGKENEDFETTDK